MTKTIYISGTSDDAPPIREVTEWYALDEPNAALYALHLAPAESDGRVLWALKAWRLSAAHPWSYDTSPVDFVASPTPGTDVEQAKLLASLRRDLVADVQAGVTRLDDLHARVPRTFRRTEGFLMKGPSNPTLGEGKTVPY